MEKESQGIACYEITDVSSTLFLFKRERCQLNTQGGSRGGALKVV